jgi:hypothetical protein
MGRENQAIGILWADLASHFARKMTREPFLDTLCCLAKHLEDESNGWRSNKGEARLLKQFPLETCQKLFPWLNLSTWESPVRAWIAGIGLLHEQQISMESRHSRRDKFTVMI